MAKNNKRKRHISCLGVLLIFCMLLVVASTVAINLLFRNGAAPSFLGNRYVHYTEDDMPSRVPQGSLVFAEDTNNITQKDIVLYRNEENQYRIAVASLIVDTDSNVPDQTGKTYYLTTESNTTAVQVEESSIVGICKRRSKELGALIGFLLSLPGTIIGLALPLLIILIYLISSISKKKDAEGLSEDEDNDLAFVKSIQQKQQQAVSEFLTSLEQKYSWEKPEQLMTKAEAEAAKADASKAEAAKSDASKAEAAKSDASKAEPAKK